MAAQKFLSITPELPDNIEDIDAGDEETSMCTSIYIKDIYKYLTKLEVKYPIEENFLSKQVQITANMRAIVIDWVVDVQVQFYPVLDIFDLTVGIIDRYLQAVPDLDRNQLQLVAVTAMLIASKYEARTCPIMVDGLVYVTDKSCSKKDILRCEREILTKLGFCLARPTPHSFLTRFHKAASGGTKEYLLAKYLVDLSLVEATMAHYRPSELAAAAICLSLSVLSREVHKHVWTPTMIHYSGYALEHLLPIVKKISLLVIGVSSSKYTAVYRKYSHIRFEKVAILASAATMFAYTI